MIWRRGRRVEVVAPALFDSTVVVWIDAHAATLRWTTFDELEINEREIVSVGFLVQDDDEHVVLAQSMDHVTDSVDSVLVIPRACVRSLRRAP